MKCLKCGSNKIETRGVMGLCAFNEWKDRVCMNCGERWEKGSKIDKRIKCQPK